MIMTMTRIATFDDINDNTGKYDNEGKNYEDHESRWGYNANHAKLRV